MWRVPLTCVWVMLGVLVLARTTLCQQVRRGQGTNAWGRLMMGGQAWFPLVYAAAMMWWRWGMRRMRVVVAF